MGYTFGGGREIFNLLNTDMKRELDHLAAFLHMAIDHANKIDLRVPFILNLNHGNRPLTNMTDAAACLNFLREYGLMDRFRLNIETNHATWPATRWSMSYVSANAGMLGSIDANRGDELIGWDTDQFPTDIYLTTQVMLVLLEPAVSPPEV